MGVPQHAVAVLLACILAFAPINTLGGNPPCTKYHTVTGADTCNSIVAAAGISVGTLYSLNPSLHKSCNGLHSLRVRGGPALLSLGGCTSF